MSGWVEVYCAGMILAVMSTRWLWPGLKMGEEDESPCRAFAADIGLVNGMESFVWYTSTVPKITIVGTVEWYCTDEKLHLSR